MTLPVTVPNQFANATSSIPLSQLDSNFNTLSNVINQINAGTQQLSNANVAILIVNAGTSAAPSITTTGDTNTGIFFPAADTIAFAEGGAEAMRIDSDGDVGIGTNAPSTKLHVFSTGSVGIQSQTSGAGAGFFQAKNSSGSSYLGQDSTGGYLLTDYSAPFLFYTNNTESARITSGGYFKASNTGTYNNATGAYHELRNNNDNNNTFVFTHSGTGPYGGVIEFTGAAPDNNANYFLQCSDTSAVRMYIYSDGDVWTSDAGTLSSDQKLKNTITDASPKLDDVMRLRVRNYYWNKDYHPEKTDKKLIGFIAQEFEEVFPGLVTEAVIRGGNPIYEDQAVVDEDGNSVLDEDGNPKTERVQVGETEKEYAKGIKEGKLIPILVKAIQELKAITDTQAQTISALEARIAALENA